MAVVHPYCKDAGILTVSARTSKDYDQPFMRSICCYRQAHPCINAILTHAFRGETHRSRKMFCADLGATIPVMLKYTSDENTVERLSY